MMGGLMTGRDHTITKIDGMVPVADFVDQPLLGRAIKWHTSSTLALLAGEWQDLQLTWLRPSVGSALGRSRTGKRPTQRDGRQFCRCADVFYRNALPAPTHWPQRMSLDARHPQD